MRRSPKGSNSHMTGKLTHWAKLLVGCTLGLTVIFVSLRLWDKIHIVILFPEDLLLHHIPTLFIKPSVSVLNLPPPSPPRLPSCPSVFVLLVSSQSHPACSKLSSTLHPSSPYRCSNKKKKRPGKVKMCVGLGLMYAIHFTALSSPRKEVLFLT